MDPDLIYGCVLTKPIAFKVHLRSANGMKPPMATFKRSIKASKQARHITAAQYLAFVDWVNPTIIIKIMKEISFIIVNTYLCSN